MTDLNDEVTLTTPDLELASEQEQDEQTLSELTATQDAQAREYAVEFIKHVIRLRGVKIERNKFLEQELRKLALSKAQIDAAITANPAQAGVSLKQLDKLADATVNFETRKSASMSFAAGLPGGFAMLASVPADVTQYYVHAFRVMQKLAFLYGWQDLLGNLEDADDETVGKLSLFLGVMMGVGGASASLSHFATQVARPALQKQIAAKALTKTAWYTPMKKTLSLIGVKVTKDSFAKTVTKAVPLAGGVISGGMTLVVLQNQSKRLQQHLRELPPPGVDAAEYRAALEALNVEQEGEESRVEAARAAVGNAVSGATASAKDAASGAASRAKNLAGNMRLRGLHRSTAENLEVDAED